MHYFETVLITLSKHFNRIGWRCVHVDPTSPHTRRRFYNVSKIPLAPYAQIPHCTRVVLISENHGLGIHM